MKYLAFAVLIFPCFVNAAVDGDVWSGEFELGYVATGGNTNESSLKSKIDLRREVEPWRYEIHLEGYNAESDSGRSAEKYFASNRLAYTISDGHYVFGYAGYEDDRFSGFDYQATVAAGYGRRLLQRPDMKWEAEIGPGYRVTKVGDTTQGEEDSEEAILRLFSKYRWDFSETASYLQELSMDKGGDNTVSKSVSALKSRIIGNLAMKLTYTVEYTQDVPNNKKHADTETAVSLAYEW